MTAINTTSTSNLSIAERLKAQQAAKAAGQPAPVSTLEGAPERDAMAEALQEIARLKAENEAFKRDAGTKQPGKAPALTTKFGEKGAVSVYGLQRFPVTLYPHSMLRFLQPENISLVLSHIASHFGEGSFKTAAQRDEAIKFLSTAGFEVAPAAVSAARITSSVAE
jgi:uncharacterized small protein (DUF1192 family)